MAKLRGDAGDNTIQGTSAADVIRGLGGRDWLYGKAGNDDMAGGSGFDVLSGGRGSDTLFGGGSTDILWGDQGDDLLSGGDGHDMLRGGVGRDRLNGGGGEDGFFYSGFAMTGRSNGRDIIEDFTDGEDHFEFAGFGEAYDTHAEILAAAEQVGADTVITLGDQATIYLLDFDADLLDESDISLGSTISGGAAGDALEATIV